MTWEERKRERETEEKKDDSEEGDGLTCPGADYVRRPAGGEEVDSEPERNQGCTGEDDGEKEG
jgi:hypothetical protein